MNSLPVAAECADIFSIQQPGDLIGENEAHDLDRFGIENLHLPFVPISPWDLQVDESHYRHITASYDLNCYSAFLNIRKNRRLSVLGK